MLLLENTKKSLRTQATTTSRDRKIGRLGRLEDWRLSDPSILPPFPPNPSALPFYNTSRSFVRNMQINQPHQTSRGMSDYQLKMAFIMPTMILLILMNIFPLLCVAVLEFPSLQSLNAHTLPNLSVFVITHASFKIQRSGGYFQTTAYFVLLAVAAQFVIGFGLALLLNREFRYKGFITTLLLLPMMLSPVVVGLFWRFILYSDNSGLLNFFLSPILKSPIGWTTHPKVAMLAVVIVDTWMWSPFMMLIALAGLSAVPKYLYEAADVDRASAWFKFRWITLPLVSPLLLIALLFRTMDAFKMFDIVYVLTREGGPWHCHGDCINEPL